MRLLRGTGSGTRCSPDTGVLACRALDATENIKKIRCRGNGGLCVSDGNYILSGIMNAWELADGGAAISRIGNLPLQIIEACLG